MACLLGQGWARPCNSSAHLCAVGRTPLTSPPRCPQLILLLGTGGASRARRAASSQAEGRADILRDHRGPGGKLRGWERGAFGSQQVSTQQSAGICIRRVCIRYRAAGKGLDGRCISRCPPQKGLAFSEGTGFPADRLLADPDNTLYSALSFEKGWRTVLFNSAVRRRHAFPVCSPSVLALRMIKGQELWQPDSRPRVLCCPADAAGPGCAEGGREGRRPEGRGQGVQAADARQDGAGGSPAPFTAAPWNFLICPLLSLR